MIKLYGTAQSRAMRPLWLLEELGVEYENVPVDFTEAAGQADYLAINPNGRVPALDDNGLILFESMAINLHLARRYGADLGLWPKSEDDQSRAIQWSIWVMTEVEPPLMDIVMNSVFLPEESRDPALVAAGQEAIPRPLKVLDQALSGREHLLGGDFTIADLNVASVLYWGPFGGLKLDPYPEVTRWLESCTARPALTKVAGG